MIKQCGSSYIVAEKEPVLGDHTLTLEGGLMNTLKTELVRTWKVQVSAKGVHLTLNGKTYELGDSHQAIVFDLERASSGYTVPEPDQGQSRPRGTPNPELRGCMADGYDTDDVNNVLGEISDDTPHTLVCLWGSYDGIGGLDGSQFYIERDGHLYELAGDLWAWLNDDPEDSDTPAEPGHPDTWLGKPAGITTRNLPWTDHRHNYARTTTA